MFLKVFGNGGVVLATDLLEINLKRVIVLLLEGYFPGFCKV